MDDPWHTWNGMHRDQWHDGGGMMDGDGAGGFLAVGVLLLVLLVLALAAVLSSLLLRGRATQPHVAVSAPPQSDAARQVLDGRLARGEVSAEEYQSVRRLLETE